MAGPSTKEAGEPAGGLLTSWKEIADHLGVTVRTAQAYEKSRALPVRRMGVRVAILESELRAWQVSSLIRPPWWARTRVLQWWALCSSSLVVAAAMGWAWYYWFHLRVGQPVFAYWDVNRLVAVDARGRTVWQRQFDRNLIAASNVTDGLGTQDLDGDGNNETVFCYNHDRRETEGWEVHCVSNTGKERWRLAATRPVSNTFKEFKPPYVVREFTMFPSPEKDGTKWTAAVFAHHIDYPSVLLVADCQGRTRGEFWHAGQLNAVRALDLNGDGIVEILVAGVQHGPEQAVLHVLDPRDVHGVARLEPPDSPLQFRGMASGTERTTVYFPRTEMNRKNEKFNWAGGMKLPGGAIQVTVNEHTLPPRGYLIWTLTRDLAAKDLMASGTYDDTVRQASDRGEWFSILDRAELEALKRQVRIVRRRP